MLGDVTIRGRLSSWDAGVVYAGHLVDQPVAVVMLTDGAETDSYGRARFDAAVQALVDDGDDVVASDRDADIAPWVALTAVGSWSDAIGVAGRVLGQVTLQAETPPAPARGPDFRPHWYHSDGVGRWRVWPLPWPSAPGSASRWTLVAAFGLMLGIATLALWIATRVFDTVPPPTPPTITRIQPSPPLTLPPTPTPPPTTPSSGPTGPQSTGGPGTSVPPIV